MKIFALLLGLSLLAAPLTRRIDAATPTPAGPSPLAGRWDLTISTPDGHTLPSWLELHEENGAWKARFVGRWGHARWLPKCSVEENGKVMFVSPKNEEGSTNDLVFVGALAGKQLKGTAQGPNGTAWTWRARRAPELRPPDAVTWGKPIHLFNGQDFAGWRFDNPAKATSWKVENGCLVNQVAGANIITQQRFKNFKLHVEFNCPAGANSGIYLRGRYEVQVEDDSIQEPANHHMGAVYGFLTPTPEAPRRPGTWQAFDITLLGRQVTVVQNGQTIIDHQEIPGITGGALDSQEGAPGPIYLQGDHGGIAYRNLVLTPARP